MKQLFPIVLICLAFGCTNINKRNSVSVKQPPTTTVKGKYVEGGASPNAYVYNHATNSDVVYLGYEYSKEQLDSVYGTCTHFSEDADPCSGGAACLYDEKGIRIDLAYGNSNGFNEKWICSVSMDKGYYTLHISDSLEVKVGDNINGLNLSHHKYVREYDKEEHNDTIFLYHKVYPDYDCPPLFVIAYKNDTVVYAQYDDFCV